MINYERNKVKKLIKRYQRSISLTDNQDIKDAYTKVISDLQGLLDKIEYNTMHYSKRKKKWFKYW